LIRSGALSPPDPIVVVAHGTQQVVLVGEEVVALDFVEELVVLDFFDDLGPLPLGPDDVDLVECLEKRVVREGQPGTTPQNGFD
jgi:hypothetical protein